MTKTAMIETDELVKVYRGGIRALDAVTLKVAPGTIFGLLGPNGAGKTTAIRILVALLAPTSGSVRVGGEDVVRRPDAVRRLVGYAGQAIAVDADLSASENLVLLGRLHGLTGRQARKRTSELLELFGLDAVAGRRVMTYSGGMRRRLDLASALVHEPPVLVLDEPTTGLDPQSRGALWTKLAGLARAGTTVLLTTQYLEEADRLCDAVAIIDAGRVVAQGGPAELKAQAGEAWVRVRVPDTAAAHAVLGTGQISGDEIHLAVPSTGLAGFVRTLDAAGIAILDVSVHQPTLDDVFLVHTGRHLRVEQAGPSRTTLGHTMATGGRRREAR